MMTDLVQRGKLRTVSAAWLLCCLAVLPLAKAAYGIEPAAAPLRTLLPEDILALQTPSDPQISPDGTRVAYVVSSFDSAKARVSRVWWTDTDGGTPQPLGSSEARQRVPRWSPDGQHLACLSQDGPGAPSRLVLHSLEDGSSQVVLADAAGVTDLRWAPDGRRVALIRRDPDRRSPGDDVRVVGEHDRHFGLWLVDIPSGKRVRLGPERVSFWSCRWSPDGSSIIGLVSDLPTPEGQEYRGRIVVVDVATGTTRVLAERTNPQAAPCYSPDGKWVAYMGPVGDFKERGIPHVIPAGGGEPTPLMRHHAGHVWNLRWHPGDGSLLIGLTEGPQSFLARLGLDGKVTRLLPMHHSLIPYWQAVWSVDAGGSTVAFLSEEERPTSQVWIGRLDGSDQRRLTTLNPQLDSIELGTVEAVRWTSGLDGAPVEGILVKPPGYRPGTPLPLVVWLHGGPAYSWGLGGHLGDWTQLLAANGYLVLLPNFRGSSGYGMDWMMANVRDWGDGPLADVMGGVDHLIEAGVADGQRLFLGGGSFGGYLSFWTITRTDRFRAAFVRAGMADLASEYALTDEPSYLVGYWGATPYDEPELYRDASPLTWADRVKTPLLIIHGERDARVPLEQGLRFHDALRHHGSPVEMVVYPGEGHSVRGYDHRIDAMGRLLEWFERWDVAHDHPDQDVVEQP
jgi:dipeptidyl aminopeptidase/acylaminoacyl peptidase